MSLQGPFYRFLKPGSIRVLELHGGMADEPLLCSITAKPLRDCQFEAISYVWGEENQKHSIPCTWNDDHPSKEGSLSAAPCEGGVRVTSNVLSLLRRFRLEDTSRTLWIDQICINQEDKQESLSQIKFMGQIFSKAVRVLVWLGDVEVTDHEQAQMTEAMNYLTMLQEGVIQTRGDIWKWLATKEKEPGKEDFIAIRHDGISPLMKVIRTSPWFRRAWTFQEIVVAREAWVFYGNHSRRWNSFYRTCQLLNSGDSIRGGRGTLQLNTAAMAGVVSRGNYQEEWSKGLIERLSSFLNLGDDRVFDQACWDMKVLLPQLRYMEATKDEDKVLALVGISSSDEYLTSYLSTPHTVDEIYLAVVKYWITTESRVELETTKVGLESRIAQLGSKSWSVPLITSRPDLTFLSNVQSSKHKLPSWVPDWSCPFDGKRLIDVPGYNASAGWYSMATIDSFNNEPRLYLKGVRILTITTIGPGPDNFSHQADLLNGLTDPYPTTNMSYLDAYKIVARPVRLDSPSQSQGIVTKFWESFNDEKESNDRLRPYCSGRYTSNDLQNTMFPLERSGGHRGNETSISTSRSFLVSTRGFIGWAPRNSQPGDLIYVISGARVPFVLRAQEDGNYKLIGECFVFGVMHGETVRNLTTNDFDHVTLV